MMLHLIIKHDQIDLSNLDGTANDVIKGHLHTYRFCDEVWTFLIEDITFKMDDNTSIEADRVKIVSCCSKKPGET